MVFFELKISIRMGEIICCFATLVGQLYYLMAKYIKSATLALLMLTLPVVVLF